MIVWLASYPRSGNTLLRMALKCFYGVETCSLHPDVDIQRMGIAELVGHRAMPGGTLDDLRQSPEVHFIKTHLAPGDDSPAIYIVRDGRDTLVSYAHYQCEVEGSDEGFQRRLVKLIVGDGPHGPWGEHVLAWLGRSATTAVVKYEAMIDDPESCLSRALAEVHVDLQPQHEPTALPEFADLRSKAPSFFRTGRPGKWRDEMPALLARQFWIWNGQGMARAGYQAGADVPSGFQQGPPWPDAESLYVWLMEELQEQLARTRSDLRERHQEIQDVRESASWRLTAPLRWLKRLLLGRR